MKDPSSNFIIAFQVLPIIIFVSALSSLLHYWGIIQKCIQAFSFVLSRFLKIDGATSFGVASSVFFGIIEGPLLIKSFLNNFNRSSLFIIMTASMATVAGTVMVLYSSILSGVIPNAATQILTASIMSAPAAIMFAELIIPYRAPETSDGRVPDAKSQSESAIEAIINGTSEGVVMVLHITGVLIVIFALISLVNMGLFSITGIDGLSIEKIVGYLFAPFCWLMGIESSEVLQAGELMGTKFIANEFVSYTKLAALTGMSSKSKLILTYAMCGFANLGSLGILVGGLGQIMPEKKAMIGKLVTKSLFVGTLATMFSGLVIGIVQSLFS